jgi:hypothetical protein
MATTGKYDPSHSLREKILYVLSTMEKGSAGEVAQEVMELDGVSSEDGVADITHDIDEELKKLCHEGVVDKLKEHRQKVRYVLHQQKASA